MAKALSKAQIASLVAEKNGLSKKKAVEILDEHLLARVVRPDDFDGDALDEIPGAVLLRLIDDAHATLENFPGDVIAEFVLDGEERHARMVGNCLVKSSPAHGNP